MKVGLSGERMGTDGRTNGRRWTSGMKTNQWMASNIEKRKAVANQ